MVTNYENLIRQAYSAFNAREIDNVLSLMHPNVRWPNGWEGGYVHGHEEVRDYWTRQWKELDPKVDPIAFRERQDGSLEVNVHQQVKDLQGNSMFDGTVIHVYFFENGLIKTMNIELA